MIYLTAATTGARWSECRRLRRGDFHLDAESPYLSIPAKSAKNKALATIPLRFDVVERLRDFWADTPALPSSPAFPNLPKGTVGAKMVRHDMKGTGLVYKTEEGVSDFHSIRHFFVSEIVASGASAARVKLLARHSDVNLSLNRYIHLRLETTSSIMEVLPAITATGFSRTGTDDTPDPVVPLLTPKGVISGENLSGIGREASSENMAIRETKKAGTSSKPRGFRRHEKWYARRGSNPRPPV